MPRASRQWFQDDLARQQKLRKLEQQQRHERELERAGRQAEAHEERLARLRRARLFYQSLFAEIDGNWAFGVATICYWCGCDLDYSSPKCNPDSATREHLIPRSLGGRDIEDNVVAACLACNNRRSIDTSWTPYHKRIGMACSA